MHQFDTLHLMKRRIMRGIDFISAIDVSAAEEGIDARSQVLALVGGGMRSKESRLGDVVGVAGGTAGVMRRDEEVIEALLRCYDWIFGVEDCVGGAVVVEGGEVLLDFGADDADGVGGAEV